MTQICFEAAQALIAGYYFPQSFSWDYDVMLGRTNTLCQPPRLQPVAIAVEVGGPPSIVRATILPGQGAPLVGVINGLVLAGQTVRLWVATYAGLPGDAATDFSMTIEVRRR